MSRHPRSTAIRCLVGGGKVIDGEGEERLSGHKVLLQEAAA